MAVPVPPPLEELEAEFAKVLAECEAVDDLSKAEGAIYSSLQRLGRAMLKRKIEVEAAKAASVKAAFSPS